MQAKQEILYLTSETLLKLNAQLCEWEPEPNTTYRLIINHIAKDNDLKLLSYCLLSDIEKALIPKLRCFVVQFNAITEAQLVKFFSQNNMHMLPRYVFKMGACDEAALISWYNAITRLLSLGHFLPNEIIFDLRQGISDEELILPLRKRLHMSTTVSEKFCILYRTVSETNLKLTKSVVRDNPPCPTEIEQLVMNPPELWFEVRRPRAFTLVEEDLSKLSIDLQACANTHSTAAPVPVPMHKRASLMKSIWAPPNENALAIIEEVGEEDDDDGSLVCSEWTPTSILSTSST